MKIFQIPAKRFFFFFSVKTYNILRHFSSNLCCIKKKGSEMSRIYYHHLTIPPTNLEILYNYALNNPNGAF